MKQIFNIILMTCILSTTASAQNTIQIGGYAKDGDTVKIRLWERYLGTRQRDISCRNLTQICTNGTYSFKFDGINSPAYFSIEFGLRGRMSSLQYYLIMPGDSVSIIRKTASAVSFAGKGAEGLNCRYIMDSVGLKTSLRISKTRDALSYRTKNQPLLTLKYQLESYDSSAAVRQTILNGYARSLKKEQYEILQAEIMGSLAIERLGAYERIRFALVNDPKSDSTDYQKDELYRLFRDETTTSGLSEKARYTSKKHIDALILRAVTGNRFYQKSEPQQILADQYGGILRDKLLTVYLLDYTTKSLSPDSIVIAALKMIKTDYCREALYVYLSQSLVGKPAYNFKLEDSFGNKRQLSEFRGKRVILDFWFTGCPGCVGFYKGALKEVEKKYAGDNSIVFISIAGDADRKIWLESIEQDIYTSKSTINLITYETTFSHDVFTKYNVKAAPTLVVIDESGTIIRNQVPPRKKDQLIELIYSK